MHFLVVTGNFYTEIAEMLEAGAVAALKQNDIHYTVMQVPGALEIPAVIARGGESGEFDGFVALGCVIRGETSHYETVCNESARGLMDLAIHYGLAIGNGIITTEDKAQAICRADPEQSNKGGEAVLAALSVARSFSAE